MMRVGFALLCALTALMVLPQSAPAATLPEGVPDDAQEARIWGWVDGDTVKVRIGDKTETLELTGVDTPELATDDADAECFGEEASVHLKTLIEKQQTVYLEKDEENRNDDENLLRYVWVPGEKSTDKAFLLNTKMLRDGYGGFKQMKPNTKYDDNLKKAHRDAKAKKRGMWEFCASVHSTTTLTVAQSNPPGADSPQTGLTAEESAYTFSIGQYATIMSDSLNRFNALSNDPRLLDDDWRLSMVAELVLWQLTYDEVAKIDPPSAFADLHAVFLEALENYSSAADNLLTWLDTFDETEITSASAKMTRANELIREASALLDDILAAHGETSVGRAA